MTGKRKSFSAPQKILIFHLVEHQFSKTKQYYVEKTWKKRKEKKDEIKKKGENCVLRLVREHVL